MVVLVVGGVGYIGSYIVIEFLELGYEVVIVDNLSNSNLIVVDRIKELFKKLVKFYNIDIRNKDEMYVVFKENNIELIIYFVVLKVVGELVEKLIEYYSNNLISILNLFELMREYGVKKFVFSFLVIVYGDLYICFILEDFLFFVINLYGRIKFMIE